MRACTVAASVLCAFVALLVGVSRVEHTQTHFAQRNARDVDLDRAGIALHTDQSLFGRHAFASSVRAHANATHTSLLDIELRVPAQWQHTAGAASALISLFGVVAQPHVALRLARAPPVRDTQTYGTVILTVSVPFDDTPMRAFGSDDGAATAWWRQLWPRTHGRITWRMWASHLAGPTLALIVEQKTEIHAPWLALVAFDESLRNAHSAFLDTVCTELERTHSKPDRRPRAGNLI